MGMMEANLWRNPGAVITSYASGNWGGTGLTHKGNGFSCSGQVCTVKELLPIAVACAICDRI